MSDIAIRVENISKQYYIGGPQQAYPTFREVLTNAVTSPFRRAAALLRGHAYGAAALNEAIWALKDVSFEVKHGEVIGIIGRNGAGKSTLLKILSRITEPTTGYADIYGRVGSLLEVGTGFHPELTGRENVYLNGSILGMKRHEIKRRFDEIVEFSGVEKFIDTPVKHYSSGMKVRLAFSVAAHLDPEILIVDEVLAVGDAEFQKKCLGKMSDVTDEGRTVLFVSHNMQAVRRLCEKAVLLEGGGVRAIGDVESIVDLYLTRKSIPTTYGTISPEMHKTYPPTLEIYQFEFFDHQGEPTTTLLMDEVFCFRLHYKIQKGNRGYYVVIRFRDKNDVLVAVTNSKKTGVTLSDRIQEGFLDVTIQNIFLDGNYTIELVVKDFSSKVVDVIDNIPFSVAPASVTSAALNIEGIVRLNATWMLPATQEVI